MDVDDTIVQETLTLLGRASGRADGFGGDRFARNTSSDANFELDIRDKEFALKTRWEEGPLAPNNGGICGRGDGSLWTTKRLCILFEHEGVVVGGRGGLCAERHRGIAESRADFGLFLELGDGRRDRGII